MSSFGNHSSVYYDVSGSDVWDKKIQIPVLGELIVWPKVPGHQLGR